tara:strand:- start:36 stop:203 length:168 start_codon:yes stop_codon:yes gene_type:complete
MTLQEMIEKYETLTEEQQVHVDAALDSQDDDGLCLCGKKLSDGNLECYSHMTQGY